MSIRCFAVVVMLALLPVVAAAEDKCNRECLEGYVDRYLDAMLAHEVDPELFAENVIFTENGVRLPFGGEGLWYRMSGKGTYKFYIPDIETQQIAFIGTVKERGISGEHTVALALRLKIVDKLITEVEQLAIRPEESLFGGGGGEWARKPIHRLPTY